MKTETMREYGDRVRAAIDGWTDKQVGQRMRLLSNWAGAADRMFWAQQFGQPITDEMRDDVYTAGEAVLNA